jgi:hypothetical protein
MGTMSTITRLLQPHDFLTSIDLQDAFHHILIHPSSQPLLRFCWKQWTYQYRALPFGFSFSPLIFTKALKPLLRWIRRKGIRLSAYLGDLIIMTKSKQESLRHAEQVCQKMTEIGWLINFKKSSLTPSQQITHLGFTIDSNKMSLSLPGKKVRSIRRVAYSLLKKAFISWTALARFTGMALATSLGNQQAGFQTRHMVSQLNLFRHQRQCLLTPKIKQGLV